MEVKQFLSSFFRTIMVSIVEVEIFGFSSLPYLPDFYNELSKLGQFRAKIANNNGILDVVA